MPSFLLTIDVEDWFQVENLRPWIPFSTWDSRELRVEANVHKLLDLLDDVKLDVSNSELTNPENLVNPTGKFSGSAPRFNPKNSTNPKSPTNRSLRATFFVLGWVAKRLPHLVREIAARGHEVASHGFNHQMCSRLSEAELREELCKSKRLLEEITGTEVSGFRAPNFSIEDRVLSMLQETGYCYDSSYNNFSLHYRYGKISINGTRAGIAHQLSDNFYELPISNLFFFSCPSIVTSGALNFRHFLLPWGGGAYFRIMPLLIFTMGIRTILKKEGAYIFYMHPWEIDNCQPKVEQSSLFSRFKHYRNIKNTEGKLKKMVETFVGCRFMTCREYLEAISKKTD